MFVRVQIGGLVSVLNRLSPYCNYRAKLHLNSEKLVCVGTDFSFVPRVSEEYVGAMLFGILLPFLHIDLTDFLFPFITDNRLSVGRADDNQRVVVVKGFLARGKGDGFLALVVVDGDGCLTNQFCQSAVVVVVHLDLLFKDVKITLSEDVGIGILGKGIVEGVFGIGVFHPHFLARLEVEFTHPFGRLLDLGEHLHVLAVVADVSEVVDNENKDFHLSLVLVRIDYCEYRAKPYYFGRKRPIICHISSLENSLRSS